MRQVSVNWHGAELRREPVVTSQRDEVTELDRHVWLLVRDQGGYWTWEDVRREIGACQDRGPSPLMRLWNRCHLVRRERVRNGEARWEFGVTAQCDPLPGLTLEPAPLGLQS